MLLLLPELIHLIALKLNFRSLLNLRRTCKKYYVLLSELVRTQTGELFDQYSGLYEKVQFIPGPAINGLPKRFPIDGIYFFDIDDKHQQYIHFFFKKFSKKKMFKPNNTIKNFKYIATINNRVKKIHKYDHGYYWLYASSSSIGHCIDFNLHHKELFRLGKQIMKRFWNAL